MNIDSVGSDQKTTPITYFVAGFVFMSAILFYLGIKLSRNILTSTQYIIFWFIYVITIVTLGNSIFNYYTLITINKKTGIPGDKGEPGVEGDKGDEGDCEKDCKLKTFSKSVLLKLDKAYNVVLEKSIGEKIDPPKKINNTYIKNLVVRICDSPQFKQVSQLRHPTNLLSYITEIFIKWFDLIAAADNSENKKHFQEYMDIYGEQREWESMVDNQYNPFHEIEKYDIFYWGLDKEFHPIKLKSCVKQPPPPIKPPIKAFKTNVYTWDWDDKGTRARDSFSTFFTPPMTIDGEVYYPLGVIGESGYAIQNKNKSGKFIEKLGGKVPVRYDIPGNKYAGPNKTNVIVSASSKWVKKPHPDHWSWKFNGKRSNSIRNKFRRNSGKPMSFWNAEDFYEDGELYRCFGSMIARQDYHWNQKPFNKTNRDKVPFVCINDKALEPLPPKHGRIWTDAGSGRKFSGAIFNNNDGIYNLAYTNNNYGPDNNRKMYKLKSEFLEDIVFNEKQFTSENEKDVGYGVGFQEVKYEKNRDGSLFNLLDLVVKAPLEGVYNNKLLFLEHSGLNNPNSYFIKEYEVMTNKPDKCLKTGGAFTKSVECNPTQNAQIWEIEFLEQSSELCLLKSVDTGKYLYSNNPSRFGISGDIPSRNIDDVYLKPYIWRIQKDKKLII